MNIKDFLAKYSAARNKQNEWRTLHEECYHYAMPNKNNFSNDGNTSGNGSRLKNTHLFDNTAVEATSKFASRFQQLTAPVEQQYFKITLSDYAKQEIYKNNKPEVAEMMLKESQIGLDEITAKLYHFYSKSNINTNIHECFHDLAIGTCSLIVNENNDNRIPFLCSSIPLHQLSILEGKFGTIDTVFRKHYAPIKSIEAMWPKADLSFLTEEDRKSPDQKIEIIEGVSYNELTFKFDYDVVVKDNKIFSAVYITNPFVVSRYKVASGEVYGRGPLMDILNDIKLVNKAQEYVLKAAEKASSEFYLVAGTDTMAAELGLTLGPDVVINIDSSEKFERLPFMGRVDITQLFVSEKQNNIKRTLLATSIDRPKALSPEEINALSNENIFDMAPNANRIYNEFLTPIIKRMLDILMRKSIIPKFDIDNGLKIEYTTPMTMLNKQRENQEILTTMSQIANSFGPEVAQTIVDPYKLAKRIAENNNILSTFVRTDIEIQQIQQQKQQQMQQQQMAEGMEGQV